MKKFKITQIDTIEYIYETEAETEEEAKENVLWGRASHLPEYDEIINRIYKIEEEK